MNEVLPEPVARYFQNVLAIGQTSIRKVEIKQSGTLRTSENSEKWLSFSAHQVVLPIEKTFTWIAKIKLFGPLFISILDSYQNGIGCGQAKLFSLITVAEDQNIPEINSGELHRFLAEAPWYPTALLPESGVRWNAIDNHRALANLADKNNSVSLEFRFNDKGEITGIYSPGRWCKVKEGFKQIPWEGHFFDYKIVQGISIPHRAEVGWYNNQGQLNIVWKGEIISAQFDWQSSS